MVAATEAVGRQFAAADLPTIWRVHAPPGADALAHLAEVLADYGVPVREAELHAEAGMAKLLRRLDGHRAARPLCYLVLRALSQATYSTANVGHFGLASDAYLHFTSPIRRYPDLHVHRLVKAMLGGGKPASRETLQAIARESTAAERRTIEVEREVASLYAASLMRDRIGDEHAGTICGLTSFGFFVALDTPCVEGLVRSERLRDWLELDGERLRLFGRDSGRVYSLGDRVRVRVIDASIARRQIALELLPGEESHEPDPLASRAERPRRRGPGRDGRGERGHRERRGRDHGGRRGRNVRRGKGRR
jgi:ribonuclease R